MKNNQHIVSQDELGLRLDQLLSSLDLNLSRSQIKKLILSKNVLVNNNSVKPSLSLNPGDKVIWLLPEKKPFILKQESLSIDVPIVFEDEHLLIVNKPAGIVVHPGAGHHSGTLAHGFFSKLAPNPDAPERPGVVHRLDKDTSGLMVLAKSPKALTHLALQFKNKSATRIYKALCHGKLKSLNGTFKSFLIRHPKNRKKYHSSPEDQGKEAVTHYKVLKSTDHLSLVELQLETGRTHQIRVHLSEQGHPILQDPIYGTQKRWQEIQNTQLRSRAKKLNGLSLVAVQLQLTHPTTLTPLSFQIDWPKEFDLI